jgi:hypothetical protein
LHRRFTGTKNEREQLEHLNTVNNIGGLSKIVGCASFFVLLVAFLRPGAR